ncbi:hypothetical protein O6H91_08G041700 [Diphasiastrum complanatum]|uniref:Uncharacterized protein n=1 Tax=Diphasiastrum complanatum TaxID=34168 RepID=A0ACC2CWT7_DIPCM|nr:hypothetical protein O6H91_08G041700 [Diphasiastrum complanatum]
MATVIATIFVEEASNYFPVNYSEVVSLDSPVTHPEVAILFVGVCLCLGALSRQLLSGTKVPYTVALLLVGIGLGALEYGTSHGLGSLGKSIRATINPNLILFVFLPALLFESSFAMDIHQIKRCMVQMLLLAGPGVAISTFCLGLVHHFIFPYGWNWSTSLLLGGLLSATDPVAVVALLKELGASKKLSTLIEGESLMNDGTAMVVFQLFLQLLLGQHFSAGEIVKFLAQVSLGAVALGLGFGLMAVLWLGAVFNDTVIEITVTFTTSYLAFYTAQNEANVSGVLTVMTVGIFFAAFAKTAFKGESQQSMHHFWNMVSYIANTIIFILRCGVVIAESILRSHNNIEGHDWLYLVLLYLFLQLSRAVVVIVLYPGLCYYGYGLNWKEAIILIWAGLRGAVALALSLSVNLGSSQNSTTDLQIKKTEARFVFFTGGVVFLTLIINGSTTQFLLQLLHMDKALETKIRIVEYVQHEMNNRALDLFGELGEDEEFGPADWSTVRNYISCLNYFTQEETVIHPHEASTVEGLYNMQLQDTRLRFLNGVQAAYWRMLEEGRITQRAAILLMQSVDEALDKVVSEQKLLDWKGLISHVYFPSYLKQLHSRYCCFLPQKLLSLLIVQRLELGCYISAAFLRAHMHARRHLRDFIGESEVAEAIIRESQAEGEWARQFLEDVRLTFPQVLRVVKTRQVIYAILLNLSEYVQSLEKAGLLEEKETSHLHDAVQVDLKNLLRNPPLVKMPKGQETLISQPFLGALPDILHRHLVDTAKECMKLRDDCLYKEASKPDEIWLIANGVVKWSRKATTDWHLLHPTFSHGSTLGLYEALTGKPHLCDVTADSVVHCFSIETSAILSALQSEPNVEDFFWQESAVAVSKIVLPRFFEAMATQELRALIMEGSTMLSFIRGEVLELHVGEVGILLEGFLKHEGKDEIIAAPAGLVFSGSESHHAPDGKDEGLSCSGTCFQVEARSRILILNVRPSLSGLVLKSTASVQSGSMPLPRHVSQDRDALLIWSQIRRMPEHPVSSLSQSTAAGGLAGSQSMSATMLARATELGLFGSKVLRLNKSWRGRSLGQIQKRTQPQTMFNKPSGGQKDFSLYMPHTLQGKRRSLIYSGFQSQENVFTNSVFAPLPLLRTRRQQSGESSDSSDLEEEHIVEIDSPSRLFYSHLLS